MKSEKQSEKQKPGQTFMQTIVGRVLHRELEHKRQQFDSLSTDIAETERTLAGMRDHRAELDKDIKVLEAAVKDLEK